MAPGIAPRLALAATQLPPAADTAFQWQMGPHLSSHLPARWFAGAQPLATALEGRPSRSMQLATLAVRPPNATAQHICQLSVVKVDRYLLSNFSPVQFFLLSILSQVPSRILPRCVLQKERQRFVLPSSLNCAGFWPSLSVWRGRYLEVQVRISTDRPRRALA
jgi:hypothetical protein